MEFQDRLNNSNLGIKIEGRRDGWYAIVETDFMREHPNYHPHPVNAVKISGNILAPVGKINEPMGEYKSKAEYERYVINQGQDYIDVESFKRKIFDCESALKEQRLRDDFDQRIDAYGRGQKGFENIIYMLKRRDNNKVMLQYVKDALFNGGDDRELADKYEAKYIRSRVGLFASKSTKERSLDAWDELKKYVSELKENPFLSEYLGEMETRDVTVSDVAKTLKDLMDYADKKRSETVDGRNRLHGKGEYLIAGDRYVSKVEEYLKAKILSMRIDDKWKDCETYKEIQKRVQETKARLEKDAGSLKGQKSGVIKASEDSDEKILKAKIEKEKADLKVKVDKDVKIIEERSVSALKRCGAKETDREKAIAGIIDGVVKDKDMVYLTSVVNAVFSKEGGTVRDCGVDVEMVTKNIVARREQRAQMKELAIQRK